jgi:hypothetical protein
VGIKLNGSHHLQAYTDDVNLLGVNIATVKKNIGTLIDASKGVRLEINIEIYCYCCLITRMQVKITT